MAYFLAVASAVLYGSADFLGGLSAKRVNTTAVVVVSQLAGMVLLAVMMPWLPGGFPSAVDVALGAAAGLTGGAGVALLYAALAAGTMAVVAPTTAVCAVTIPVAAGILLGERPGVRVFVGIGVALLAIVLVSRPRTDDARDPASSSGLGLALLSGVAIGLFFLSLARSSTTAGLWPLLVARVVSVGLFGAGAAVTGIPLRMERRSAITVVAAGALDMLANALYLIATRHGSLTAVVTLSSLYPASTVVLARIVLGERFSRAQGVGIACALLAVVLIVGGN